MWTKQKNLQIRLFLKLWILLFKGIHKANKICGCVPYLYSHVKEPVRTIIPSPLKKSSKIYNLAIVVHKWKDLVDL